MSSTIPHPAETLHVANQVLVTIAVRGNKLSMYPQRSGDVRAYFRKPGHSDHKPFEVRWAVTGLKEGQSIEIKSSKDVDPIFPREPYVITHPHNTICSDSPMRGPGNPHDTLRWKYDIRLFEGAKELDLIDPDVEIKEDP